MVSFSLALIMVALRGENIECMNKEYGATETFGLLAAVEMALVQIIGGYTSNTETLYNGFSGADIAAALGSVTDLVAVVGTAGIVSALVGRAMWRLIVESTDRWTLPLRGALAGGLTGWISIPPIAMALVTVDQYSSVSGFVASVASPVALAEFGMGFVLFGILGTIGIGWLTIPTAAIAGYFLSREIDSEGASTGN